MSLSHWLIRKILSKTTDSFFCSDLAPFYKYLHAFATAKLSKAPNKIVKTPDYFVTFGGLYTSPSPVISGMRFSTLPQLSIQSCLAV